MSPSPPTPGSSRPSADELNEQIRALWTGRGHPALPLSEAQRAEYHRLLAELDRVERGDVVEAA
ncbi:hypothetical protein M2155_000543 [Streptomyces sp. SAI-119]|uniref:hypothetical protein n=1 Tax=Streptomyces sp. SAI-119 TaxID=2940541 RepID=UPI002475CCA6|nr:hypothetical protein [Streptomyces sp. SAI-119]MDH6448135.1 hypothetical protein [Streptomyces sp. SAI-119]